MRRAIFSMIVDARSRFGEKPFAFHERDSGLTYGTFLMTQVSEKRLWPSTLRFIEKAFNEENGLITSTLKLVRDRAVELYADLIEYIIDSDDSYYKNHRNVEALRSFFQYAGG